MSRTFDGRNGLTAKNIFKSRRDYKYLATPESSIPMVDFWYDDCLYGKVDALGNAIYPIIDTPYAMVPLSLNKEPITTMFFVDKAYFDFKTVYNSLIIEDLVSPLPAYDVFKVAKALTPLEEIYSSHISELIGFFVGVYLPQFDKCIKTFDDFIKYFLRFMREHGLTAPVTKTGFIMKPTTPNSISGLILDLEHGPQSVDSPKQDFFKDATCSYEAFQLQASKYGFLIDKNAPWRIVANVRSEKISPSMYARGGTVVNPDHIFEKYYFKSYKEDMHALFYFVFNSYVLYFAKNPYIFYSGKPSESNDWPVTVTPSQHSVANVTKKTSRAVVRRRIEQIKYDLKNSNFWFELLLKTRLLETVKDRNMCNSISDATMRTQDFLTSDFTGKIYHINEIVKSYDVRISKENLFLDKYSRTSVTSKSEDHRHIYRVDENGNGWAEYSEHPESSSIRHRHEIRNYIVMPSKSGCYPNCKKKYGFSGVPTHSHKIDIVSGQVSEKTYALSKSSTRRMPNRLKSAFGTEEALEEIVIKYSSSLEKLNKRLDYLKLRTPGSALNSRDDHYLKAIRNILREEGYTNASAEVDKEMLDRIKNPTGRSLP